MVPLLRLGFQFTVVASSMVLDSVIVDWGGVMELGSRANGDGLG